MAADEHSIAKPDALIKVRKKAIGKDLGAVFAIVIVVVVIVVVVIVVINIVAAANNSLRTNIFEGVEYFVKARACISASAASGHKWGLCRFFLA